LAASIREEFGIESELIKGDKGIFDVEVDGRRIFSKHEAGRFPKNEEILELLRR
jgi:selenoprotein W-related protein